MRKVFNVSAKEYLTEMPTWEAEVLFNQLSQELRARAKAEGR